jgi:hypothetical protein
MLYSNNYDQAKIKADYDDSINLIEHYKNQVKENALNFSYKLHQTNYPDEERIEQAIRLRKVRVGLVYTPSKTMNMSKSSKTLEPSASEKKQIAEEGFFLAIAGALKKAKLEKTRKDYKDFYDILIDA